MNEALTPHEIYLAKIAELQPDSGKLPFQIVLSAHQSIEEAYSNITSTTGRQHVRSFIARDTELLHVESAVNEQCKIAMAGDSEAFIRVGQGMVYWKQLIMREVRKAWNLK